MNTDDAGRFPVTKRNSLRGEALTAVTGDSNRRSDVAFHSWGHARHVGVRDGDATDKNVPEQTLQCASKPEA